VDIFRRVIVIGGSALVLLAGLGPRSARADTVNIAELMQPSKIGDVAMGSETAPVTIVEYASMTCHFCAEFSVKTFPALKERYIDTGKVRFILREFPFDPLAAGAAMLARCIDKDKYYPMIETLFEQQPKWKVQNPLQPLFDIAKQAGFTKESFDACLSNQELLNGIEEVRKRGAEQFKVNSTPTFFINGERLQGAQPFAEFEKIIERHLKS
jgi:protein-disulfide isomerase